MNTTKALSTNLPVLHRNEFQNFLKLETGPNPAKYAETTHRALTKFLGLFFAQSSVELDEAGTQVLNSITHLMVGFVVQPFTLQPHSGQSENRGQTHFFLATGNVSPEKFGRDAHKALNLTMRTVLENTQLDLDAKDAKVLSRIVDLMMRLQAAWEDLSSEKHA